MVQVMVVEDDPGIRSNMVAAIRDQGFAVTAVGTAEEALERLGDPEAPAPGVLLVDVRLPGASGVDLVKELVEAASLPPTIMVSGEASIGETVEALRLGVYDFIEKPFTVERLLRSIHNARRHADLSRQLAVLRARLDGERALLGASPVMDELRELVGKAAASESRVLIQGESGTGKELVADALHEGSRRREGPFVKINCAAIPAQLVEDELFGHVRGAFTDAHADKAGLFEEADGGTLFLDEIGELDATLQARLLRVLEDGRVRRVGGTSERTVDVRIISATNRELDGAEAAVFRQDLYFRLAHLVIEVPPLRCRGGDVGVLFSHFVDEACRRNHRRRPRIDDEVIRLLERYPWPGNVRELKNVCERVVVFGGDPIRPEDLPPAVFDVEARGETGLLRLNETTPALPLREFKRRTEKEYLESVLQRADWNVTAAAEALDIQRTYLHQKMAALGIRRPEGRG